MQRFWHPQTRYQALRTLEYVAVITASVIVLVMLTDEPGSTTGMRTARVCAMAPGVVCLATWAVLGQARARGELRALATLGTSPIAAHAGTLITGWCCLVCALTALLLLPTSDLAALFPAAASSIVWSPGAAGVWTAPAHAVSALADGSIRLGVLSVVAAGNATSLPLATAAAFFPLALVVPPWACWPMRWQTRILSGGGTILLLLSSLHAVAAGRLPEPLLVPVAVPLLAGLGAQLLGTRTRPQRSRA